MSYVERDDRKAQIPEVKYTFTVQFSPKPLEGVTARYLKLGEIISTPEGPCRVIEIFWISQYKANVLLRKADEKFARNKESRTPKDRNRPSKSSSKNQKRKNPRGRG